MAKIVHVAIWVKDVNRSAEFWREHFGAQIGEAYESRRRKGFVSRFVTLAGAKIELMQGPWIRERETEDETLGWAHVAIEVGSREVVETLASKFQTLGLLLSGPRQTGDGYFEAEITDLEGNRIEITASAST